MNRELPVIQPPLHECWRAVGFYTVSCLGRIRREIKGPTNAKPGRILKQKLRKDQYCEVALYTKDGRREVRVHQLVAEAFLGPCPPGHQVNHKNGGKHENGLVKPPRLERRGFLCR